MPVVTGRLDVPGRCAAAGHVRGRARCRVREDEQARDHLGDGKAVRLGALGSRQLRGAASAKPSLYRAALISWRAGARMRPATRCSGAGRGTPGRLPSTPAYTAATSLLVEGLTPGTWYYRVRGIDPYVPGPVKQMSWSTPVGDHDRQAALHRPDAASPSGRSRRREQPLLGSGGAGTRATSRQARRSASSASSGAPTTST